MINFLTSHFGIIIDSQELAKIVQKDCYLSLIFPSGYILHNYGSIAKLGIGHCAWVTMWEIQCASLVLHHLMACLDLCN